MSPEPGTTMARTVFAMRLPLARLAASRKSSIREFVQDPMNTRSILMSVMGMLAVRPI